MTCQVCGREPDTAGNCGCVDKCSCLPPGPVVAPPAECARCGRTKEGCCVATGGIGYTINTPDSQIVEQLTRIANALENLVHNVR